MPNVKIGEIVIVQDHIAKRAYKGLVININWNTVSCIFFTDTRTILPGMKTRRSSWPVSIRLTSDTVGNIVDCLGYPLKHTNVQHTSTKTATIRLERPAPGITLREPIYQPLHTGSILIDSLFPIGRGQRELILGDRQTGKTSIAINAIRTQKYDNLLRFFNKNLYCFYVAIGQKKIKYY
jgi:F-type H+-transporting ATPase subunit alpha